VPTVSSRASGMAMALPDSLALATDTTLIMQ
jgi:hypothetical protein